MGCTILSGQVQKEERSQKEMTDIDYVMAFLKSKEDGKLQLKKDKCCCGGTKNTPCVCMIQGNDCSASSPKCPCYALMDKQKKSIKKMVGVF